MSQIRVIVVDDHPVVRAGLKQIMASAHDIKIVAEADNGNDALDILRKEPVDVIVMDVSMPGMGGLDVLKQLKVEKPHIPVLMLSVHPENQYAVRVLKAGASGYLTKASAPAELVKAVRKLHEGERYITAQVGDSLASDLLTPRDEAKPHKTLSDREYEVLRYIGRGMTIQEIGKEMSLSPKTISTYRARILDKMGLKSTAQLIRYAVDEGLVD